MVFKSTLRFPAFFKKRFLIQNSSQVLFVSNDGSQVYDGHIIEHMHRNNYHLVEVPEFAAAAQYFETQLYWLKDGAWVKAAVRKLKKKE